MPTSTLLSTASPTPLPTLSVQETQSLLGAMKAEKNRRRTEDRLTYFKPYPKQLAFFTAGATVRERLLMAANQSGKTLASAIELACHATGRYPDWCGESGVTRTPIPAQGGQQSGDCGQRVMAA